MSELPEGWARTPISAFTRTKSGNSKLIKGKLPRESKDGLFPAFSASGQDVWVKDPEHSGNAIIVSAVGARSGKTFRAHGQWSAIANTHVVWPEETACDPDFLQHLLNNEAFWEKGGSAQPFVKVKATFEREINLPPLAEQKRIVAKIDSLTAKTARARTELAKIEALVERYRAAVYLDAFTSASDQSGNGEPDDWTRLLGARTLPLRWERARLGDIAEIQSGIALGKRRRPDQKLIELPYLRVANVQRGHLNLTEVKSTSVTEAEAEKLFLQPGDILMNEGGDRDKLGRGWIWSGEVDRCIHQNHVFRVRLTDRDFPPKYISHFANEFGKRHFFDEGTQTTNLASISKTKLSQLPVPLPPAQEAEQIVLLLERRLRFLDAVRQACHDATQLLWRLEQAILGRAFEGRLVQQSPDDEPAAELLARIKNRSEASKRDRPKRIARAAAPRAHRKTSSMTKSRFDPDVAGKPYLSSLVKAPGAPIQLEDLYQRAQLAMPDFYKQLAFEVDQGFLFEETDGLVRRA